MSIVIILIKMTTISLYVILIKMNTNSPYWKSVVLVVIPVENPAICANQQLLIS